jgi:hypothetical protein
MITELEFLGGEFILQKKDVEGCRLFEIIKCIEEQYLCIK